MSKAVGGGEGTLRVTLTKQVLLGHVVDMRARAGAARAFAMHAAAARSGRFEYDRRTAVAESLADAGAPRLWDTTGTS